MPTQDRTFIRGRRHALAAAAAALLAGCGEQKPKAAFHAIDVTGATFGQGFALTDFNGQPLPSAQSNRMAQMAPD